MSARQAELTHKAHQNVQSCTVDGRCRVAPLSGVSTLYPAQKSALVVTKHAEGLCDGDSYFISKFAVTGNCQLGISRHIQKMSSLSAPDASLTSTNSNSAPAQPHTNPGDSASMRPRRRRPRTAIQLPMEDVSKLDKDELKKIKNRIAAARARERTQQRVSELESVIRELWGRLQYLEGFVQELRPNLSLRDIYDGYEPQVQLHPGTLTSPTGAFQAPNASFDLSALAWMFTPQESQSN
ncbi:Asparagine amidase, partial [Globisporangium splendens]